MRTQFQQNMYMVAFMSKVGSFKGHKNFARFKEQAFEALRYCTDMGGQGVAARDFMNKVIVKDISDINQWLNGESELRWSQVQINKGVEKLTKQAYMRFAEENGYAKNGKEVAGGGKPEQADEKSSVLDRLEANKQKVAENDGLQDFNVTITETLRKTVSIRAKNAEEAAEIVEKQWEDSEYILDADHFSDVKFTAFAQEPAHNHKRGGEAI